MSQLTDQIQARINDIQAQIDAKTTQAKAEIQALKAVQVQLQQVLGLITPANEMALRAMQDLGIVEIKK